MIENPSDPDFTAQEPDRGGQRRLAPDQPIACEVAGERASRRAVPVRIVDPIALHLLDQRFVRCQAQIDSRPRQRLAIAARGTLADRMQIAVEVARIGYQPRELRHVAGIEVYLQHQVVAAATGLTPAAAVRRSPAVEAQQKRFARGRPVRFQRRWCDETVPAAGEHGFDDRFLQQRSEAALSQRADRAAFLHMIRQQHQRVATGEIAVKRTLSR